MESPAFVKSHSLHPSILREYDIRGIAGETLSVEDAYFIGRGFASYVQESTGTKEICVARDGRLSSPELSNALIKGMQESGASVIELGVGPTPYLYFAVKYLKKQAGVMVTGSHNPGHHNGFKFVCGLKPFYGEAIQALGQRIASQNYHSGMGDIQTLTDGAVMEAYVATLAQVLPKTGRPLKVVWDAGNGATGEVIEKLVTQLKGTHHLLFTEIDGNFPNHHPDPSVLKNLSVLIETVQKTGSDLGVAFDGDGDRLGVVDGRGRLFFGDQLLLLLAKEILAKHPGAQVIGDIKASQCLFDEVKKLGGVPIMWKTGHSLIKAKMQETGALLAGEMSGHYFYADEYYGYDDGLYAAMRLLRALSLETMTLAEHYDQLPVTYTTPEERIECADERKFVVIEEIIARLKAEKAQIVMIDGVRVQNEEGWWLIRASNTQPAIVARCEAATPTALRSMQLQVKHHLMLSGVSYLVT